MKLSSRVSALLFAALLIFVATPRAWAQPPYDGKYDVSVAHQTLRIPGQTYPLGFNVDVSRVGTTWRLVGEFGASHDRVDNAFDTGTLNFFHAGVGPRIGKFNGPVWPYGQFLTGVVHTDADLTHPFGVPTNDADWAYMIQPGAGLRVPIANNVGAVTQVDYRRVFFKEQGDNEWRFIVGAYFTFR